MISIKTNGIFHRFLTVYGNMHCKTQSTSLCDVVWRTLIGLLLISIVVVISAFFIMLLLEPLCIMSMYLKTNVLIPAFYFTGNGEGSWILSLMVWIVVGVAAILVWLEHLEEKKEDRKLQQYLKNIKNGVVSTHDVEDFVKQPNVFVEIIKGLYARIKDKTCVIVNFE